MKRKLIEIIVWMCLAGGLFCGLANISVIRMAKKRIVGPNALSEGAVDCIIVLGARVYEDGTPCTVLRDRLDTGIDLYRAGVSDRLLLSGDHGKVDYDEVTAMKAYAMEQGVPEKDIFLDHAGFSTYETMYRAVYLADRMDMEVYGVEADRGARPRMMQYWPREVLARMKDVLFVAFRPEPTYLGSPISLTGDGRVTANAPFMMPILAEGKTMIDFVSIK